MSQPKFAVIGHPIGHTMSPFIHQQLFAMRGLSFDYDVFDIPPQELEQWIPRLKEYTGFNITIPNKEAILPFLDEIDPTAAAFGSVNTVKVQNGRMKGFTTDGPGCILALERGGVSPRGNVLIAGTGGAARALAPVARCGAGQGCLSRGVGSDSPGGGRAGVAHGTGGLGADRRLLLAGMGGVPDAPGPVCAGRGGAVPPGRTGVHQRAVCVFPQTVTKKTRGGEAAS